MEAKMVLIEIIKNVIMFRFVLIQGVCVCMCVHVCIGMCVYIQMYVVRTCTPVSPLHCLLYTITNLLLT